MVHFIWIILQISYKPIQIKFYSYLLLYIFLKGDEDSTVFSKESLNLTEPQQEVETENRGCRKLFLEGDNHLPEEAQNEQQPNVKDKLLIWLC